MFSANGSSMALLGDCGLQHRGLQDGILVGDAEESITYNSGFDGSNWNRSWKLIKLPRVVTTDRK